MDKNLVMPLVIHALQMCGRSCARDIARHAGIENQEAVSALLELEKRGRAQQLNGYWWLSVDIGEPAGGKRRATDKPQQK